MHKSTPPAFSGRMYLLSATFFFVFMGAGAQQAYLVPYLQRVTPWSALRSSIVIATIYLAMVIFRIVNLRLFHTWSDRRFTIVGSLSYLYFTLAMVVIPFFPSYTFALFSAVVWGMGAALMWTGTAMQTLAIADAAGRRHGTGMGILYSSTHAGWLAGAILLGLLYKHLPAAGLHLCLLYAAASGLTLIGNLLACFLPSTGKAVREEVSIRSVLLILRRRRVLVAGFLQFASALSYGLILGMFGTYIGQTYGPEWIWVSISLYPATRMVMSFVGGILTDRIGQGPVLFGGFVFGAVGLFLTAAWHHQYAVVFAGFALGLLGSMVPVVASAIVGDATERQRRPLAYGVLFSCRDLGVVVSAAGANMLQLGMHVHAVFVVFAFVFLGCAGLSVYLGKLAGQEL